MPVLTIMAVDTPRETVERYNLAQEKCSNEWAMATLETSKGQLLIEGEAPRVSIIDTGSGKCILGRKFASTLLMCHPDLLRPARAFYTANIKKITYPLKFILAMGTEEETSVMIESLIADTDIYDVLLGMEFIGPNFGYAFPLTSEFIWLTDCKDVRDGYVPHKTARLPMNLRAGPRQQRATFMCGEITCAKDPLDAVEGDEDNPQDADTVIAMAGYAETAPAPMLVSPTFSDADMFQSAQATRTQREDRVRNQEDAARLHATCARVRPTARQPQPWRGGEWSGAYPINTGVERFHPSVVNEGVHVLDLFSGITCGGLRVVLSTRLKVKCYTSVELDECSRGIANEVLSKLQRECPHHLPDSALRGQSKKITPRH